eukprot:CAMPEP_0178633788 /NCGR_PEP_ID=MMETSP0698-20121128/12270_1 /TAXON_ID=265572 /ORGANISM="Extubocellulus spinifer, Strain CCMP396" /LENGTH=84 /DNA_ID=CAMNT_0020273385 /DNA_START=343 /DNA_END=597 /DNA_ORIENTATION=+
MMALTSARHRIGGDISLVVVVGDYIGRSNIGIDIGSGMIGSSSSAIAVIHRPSGGIGINSINYSCIGGGLFDQVFEFGASRASE